MALSDKWTLSDIRTRVRDELLDPSGRWWTDTELNDYIDSWQNRLQDQYELIWGTATVVIGGAGQVVGQTWDEVTITWDEATSSWNDIGTATSSGLSGTATYALTNVSDLLRLDAVYWNGVRLVPRTKQDLVSIMSDWKSQTSEDPLVVYQNDSTSLNLWPAPTSVGTVTFEYPVKLTFDGDNATPMGLPAWTRYSAVPYCAMRAYSRLGPNQDINKAARYKKVFEAHKHFIKLIRDRYFPTRSLTLRPGGKFEANIISPTTGPVELTT